MQLTGHSKAGKIFRLSSYIMMLPKLICLAAVLAVTANGVQSKLPTENLFFYETFDDEDPFASGKWIKSSDAKYEDQPLMVKTLSKPIEGTLFNIEIRANYNRVEQFSLSTRYLSSD